MINWLRDDAASVRNHARHRISGLAKRLLPGLFRGPATRM